MIGTMSNADQPYFLTRIFIRGDTCASGEIKTYHYPQYKRNTWWGKIFGWQDMEFSGALMEFNSKFGNRDLDHTYYNKKDKNKVKGYIDFWISFQEDIRAKTIVSKKYSHEPYPD